jgi:hypothetical protein
MKRLYRNGKLEAKKVHNAWLVRSGTFHSFAKGYRQKIEDVIADEGQTQAQAKVK